MGDEIIDTRSSILLLVVEVGGYLGLVLSIYVICLAVRAYRRLKRELNMEVKSGHR